MIFETHAHYDDKAYDNDRENLIKELKGKNIGCIINVSSTLESIDPTLKLAHENDYIYAAVGIHPSETEPLNEERFEWLKNRAMQSKVVAIGEIGLDYYYPEPDRACQKKWFIRQLELARELEKPVIIHSRDAAADTMNILKEYASDLSAVIHCFSYGKEIAAEYVKMGYYFGIGGVLTFKNANKIKEVVEMLPLERILTETDSPYLSPVPFRGKRNSSDNIKYVIEKIAEIKNLEFEEVEKALWKNAEKFYGVK